jgi:hypothetical protein
MQLRGGIIYVMDFTRATELTTDVNEAIEDAFDYHAWDEDQQERGREIRMTLAIAVKAIVKNAPPCLDRSAAIRKIREARMDANSAITHRGKY